MRRLLLLALAVAVLVYVSLPPTAPALPDAPAGHDAPVRGALHVHTRRSDGTGTTERVAQAASRAGLQFVVLTDHGDASRAPQAPAYHDGVLVIDAVEISTEHGHVVALGLPQSPYPLAGEARDVVEDIHRLGGVAIAAHPGSGKAELRWTAWEVPVDGLEYLNGDSEWRDEPAWQLARALFAYAVRPAETIALLFDRDVGTLERWDALARKRPVFALAAADAHARVALPGAEEPYTGRFALPIPGYEPVFRAFSVALPQARLEGDAALDARSVLEEIRAGRLYSSVDAIGWRPAFSFAAASGPHRAVGGEALALGGPVRIDVAVQAPPQAQIALVRDGVRLLDAHGPSLQYEAEPRPAVYRVEVTLPSAPGRPPVPWIVSNPIYVGRAEPGPRPAPAAPVQATTLYGDGEASGWVVEHSAASEGAVDVVKTVSGTQLLFRFAIAGGRATHPFAALVVPAGPVAGHDRLAFRGRASRPMRVSVQLRAPGGEAGERWHRSVFLDTTPRDVEVRFDEMSPRGATGTPTPPLDAVRSLLFVVDTVNTPAGTAGQIAIDDVRYVR